MTEAEVQWGAILFGLGPIVLMMVICLAGDWIICQTDNATGRLRDRRRAKEAKAARADNMARCIGVKRYR